MKITLELSLLAVAAVLALHLAVGEWLWLPLLALCIWLVFLSRRRTSWRLHAPYLLCLGGLVFSGILAFTNTTSDSDKFWISLERSVIAATAVLSVAYWSVQIFSNSRVGVASSAKLRFASGTLILVGALFLLFSSAAPHVLSKIHTAFEASRDGSFLFTFIWQHIALWIGTMLFAMNGFLVYFYGGLPAKRQRGEIFSERQKGWILFFCSDLITWCIFTLLILYLGARFGWPLPTSPLYQPEEEQLRVIVDGALAFFAGAVTFQVSFSNAVFFFVNAARR